MKEHLPSFVRRRMAGGGRPLLPEILGQPALVERTVQRGLSAIAERLVCIL